MTCFVASLTVTTSEPRNPSPRAYCSIHLHAECGECEWNLSLAVK
jgi:hypothetical protein